MRFSLEIRSIFILCLGVSQNLIIAGVIMARSLKTGFTHITLAPYFGLRKSMDIETDNKNLHFLNETVDD
ncbi:hypothetical protein LV92_02293 [Arenibacter echinorum]|uniref:Uncharacterized protein n=1 Tax=Arenibacter echinorum TaxID=440515 RepID=A0A327R3G0_9FLAO|nr:hypothetical protein LV92_02293 [Arenibacter echinorum]